MESTTVMKWLTTQHSNTTQTTCKTKNPQKTWYHEANLAKCEAKKTRVKAFDSAKLQLPSYLLLVCSVRLLTWLDSDPQQTHSDGWQRDWQGQYTQGVQVCTQVLATGRRLRFTSLPQVSVLTRVFGFLYTEPLGLVFQKYQNDLRLCCCLGAWTACHHQGENSQVYQTFLQGNIRRAVHQLKLWSRMM